MDKNKLQTCAIIGCEEETYKALYRIKLETTREQHLFMGLCELIMDNTYNCFTYSTLGEIGDYIGETNRTRARNFLKHCEELKMIRLEDKMGKRIYINPIYYRRTNQLSPKLLKMFNIK